MRYFFRVCEWAIDNIKPDFSKLLATISDITHWPHSILHASYPGRCDSVTMVFASEHTDVPTHMPLGFPSQTKK